MIFDYGITDEHLNQLGKLQILFEGQVIWEKDIWAPTGLSSEPTYSCYADEQVDLSELDREGTLTLKISTTNDWVRGVFDNFRVTTPAAADADDDDGCCGCQFVGAILCDRPDSNGQPHRVAPTFFRDWRFRRGGPFSGRPFFRGVRVRLIPLCDCLYCNSSESIFSPVPAPKPSLMSGRSNKLIFYYCPWSLEDG